MLTTNFKKPKAKHCKTCGDVLKTMAVSTKLCIRCFRQMAKEKRLLSLARKKEKKANSPSKLRKELDRVFSIHIRKSSADKMGVITCVCCGSRMAWQLAQNMHYNGRAKMNTRWDEENCYAGCMRCNVFLNGNYPAFTRYLLDLKGEKWLKELIRRGEQVRKWKPEDLKNLIEKYTVI